jgi:hypothetical protein
MFLQNIGSHVDYDTIHNYCCENLKSYKKVQVYKQHKPFWDWSCISMTIHTVGNRQVWRDNTEHTRNVVQSGQWKSIDEISVEVGVSVGSIHSILHKIWTCITLVNTWSQKC